MPEFSSEADDPLDPTPEPRVEKSSVGKHRRPKPADVFSPDEVKALANACSKRGTTGLRNRALVLVLWRSGIRISEALRLRASDIDRPHGQIRVLWAKGGRQRTVAVDDDALEVVDRWLDVRRRKLKIGRNVSTPIFCTLKGGPLDRKYVWAMLQRLADKAGIEKRVHPHMFRHTHAVELETEGVSVRLIQEQLGHKNLATTDAYLRRLSPTERLSEAIRRRPTPRANNT